MAIIECVPNISDGRRPEVIEMLAATVRATRGVRLLDVSSDVSHHRSVFTVVGGAEPLKAAVLALVQAAIGVIDLRSHAGGHPRIGAVDVIPFIPIDGVTMDDCVDLARQTGSAIASRFSVPVFLYEEAATGPGRTNLEDIRRGQFEGLAAKMATPEWAPDFGPAQPHPTAGATVVGARMPLIAFNVNLDTDRLEVARAIAAAVRHSGGGFRFVKAMGVALEDRGIVQVSMNLTNYERTPIHRVFAAVVSEAAAHGVAVRDTEIIGLVPAAALLDAAAHHLQLQRFSANQILETRLR